MLPILFLAATLSATAQTRTLVKMKTTASSIEVYVYYGGGTLKAANGVELPSGSVISLTPDVSGNIELIADGEVTLIWLECWGNQLTSLDVSKCTDLTGLLCDNNQLATLNIAGCTKLGTFDARGQEITATSNANPVKYTNASGAEESIKIGGTSYAFGATLPAGTHDFTTTAPMGKFPFSGTITTLVAPESNDATLKSLTVSEGTLSPTFSAATTNYTVSVANNISQITISATANDGNANVAGTGNKSLKVGSNPFNIVVTAEDGTTEKTYTVTVTRDAAPKSSDATLKSLTVSEGELSPEFSAATTSYTVSVESSIDQITIGATANDEKASVDGAGIKTLAVGDNLFDMVVTAEDGTEKTYTVNVIRKAPTDIEDVNAADIKIYQSNGILYIESSEYIKDIRLHDTSGSLVFRKINAGHSINVPILSKGIYVLTVVTTKGETIRKVRAER